MFGKKKTNVEKGKKGFQKTTPKAAKPTGGKSSATITPTSLGYEDSNTSDSLYTDTYSSFQTVSDKKKKRYRVYDSKNKPIGFYENETQAEMAAIKAGGWVREYEKKEEESLPERIFGDGRTVEAVDGKGFDIPELSPFDRPKEKYKVVDSEGRSRGSFENEYEARIKAEEVGGTVDKYVLKAAYHYKNPREQMSLMERLRDNGEAYEKVKKRK